MAGKAIDLLNQACIEIIVETIRAAEAHYACPVGLIIIDTFNKGIAMGGGDENEAKDQNIAAANLQAVQDELPDIHVALIGHTGKDESRGARGSNAHLGDVDMLVQISVAGAVRTATINKINDGVDGVLTRFRVVPVTLGTRRGRRRHHHCDRVRRGAGSGEPGRAEQDAEPGDGSAGARCSPRRASRRRRQGASIRKASRVVPLERWREHCRRGGLSPAGTKVAARQAFSRAVKDLLDCAGSASGTSWSGSSPNDGAVT